MEIQNTFFHHPNDVQHKYLTITFDLKSVLKEIKFSVESICSAHKPSIEIKSRRGEEMRAKNKQKLIIRSIRFIATSSSPAGHLKKIFCLFFSGYCENIIGVGFENVKRHSNNFAAK